MSIFIFLGCVNNKPKVLKIPQKVLPLWYESQKINTKRYIYAKANGINKDQAIARALNNIISQFSVSIESKFQSTTNVSKGLVNTYSTNSTNNIQTKVEKIKINNYEVINSYPYRYNQFLVEIRVDKIKLNIFLKDDIKRKFESLKIIENSIKDENFILKLNTYLYLYNKSKSYENSLNIIKSIDKNFNINNYFREIKKYYNKYLKLKNSFAIYIIDSNRVDLFEKKVKKYLTSQNIKISNKEVNLKIKVIKDKQYVNTPYYKMVVFNISLQLFFKDKLISRNTIEIKELDTKKSKRIEQKASQKFFNTIKNKLFIDLFKLSI